jgi:hypothetical protein
MALDMNPTVMGRPLFPTFDRTKEMVGSAFNALTSGSNPAMMAGSAGVNPFASANVPEFPSRLGPLIRTDYGLPPSERPEFRNPADQWDAKPVTARTAAITAPQPAAPSLAPTFPNTGMGIMGNQNVGPLPIEQFSPMTRMAPTLADRGNVTTDITGMQGKVPIQTPYGTIYATAGQAQTQRVSEMGGLPAQSARLANIGEQARRMGMAKAGGRQIAQGYTETMRNFANQNIGSPVNLPAPQGRFGQALVGNFPRSREATARAEQAVSPTTPLASLGSGLSFPFLEERNRNPFSSIYGLQS